MSDKVEYRAIALPDGRRIGLSDPSYGNTSNNHPTTTRWIQCDGVISHGRCMSCFQYVASSVGMHLTQVEVD